MHLRVSDEDNLFLTAVFIEEEVLEAIYSCETLKSLGPDGFNFGFLKNFRGLYKDDLLRCLDEFYDHGKLVKGLNSSFIVLIPKKKKGSESWCYRPISLVGGIYKIISKVLFRRLSKVIGSIISEQQSAFVGGRNILNSTVVLNEVIEDVKKMKEECMLFKIDFEKTYDSVEWSYLRTVMERFNFDQR